MRKKLALLILVLPFYFFVGCATNPITGRQDYDTYVRQYLYLTEFD